MNSSSVLEMDSGAGGSVAGGGTSPFVRGLGWKEMISCPCVRHAHEQIRFHNSARQFDFLDKRFAGREVAGGGEKFFAFGGEDNSRAGKILR